jgi:hypothetical protein
MGRGISDCNWCSRSMPLRFISCSIFGGTTSLSSASSDYFLLKKCS